MAALQMRLPGPPIIYDGTEVGLSQRISIREGKGMHVNRVPLSGGKSRTGIRGPTVRA